MLCYYCRRNSWMKLRETSRTQINTKIFHKCISKTVKMNDKNLSTAHTSELSVFDSNTTVERLFITIEIPWERVDKTSSRKRNRDGKNLPVNPSKMIIKGPLITVEIPENKVAAKSTKKFKIEGKNL